MNLVIVAFALNEYLINQAHIFRYQSVSVYLTKSYKNKLCLCYKLHSHFLFGAKILMNGKLEYTLKELCRNSRILVKILYSFLTFQGY